MEKMSLRKAEPNLFGEIPVLYEYYPCLVPDDDTIKSLSSLYTSFINIGLNPGQIVKNYHLSLDGTKIHENDAKVIETVTEVLSSQHPIPVRFGGLGQFLNWNNITVYLSLTNTDSILAFNKTLMEALNAKTTKLTLHLTLAKKVFPDLIQKFNVPEMVYPTNCTFDKVVILKKAYKGKGFYKAVATIPFGG
jgi:2'-5' RNA ligase